jgi:hypothetical protein
VAYGLALPVVIVFALLLALEIVDAVWLGARQWTFWLRAPVVLGGLAILWRYRQFSKRDDSL